MERPPKGLSGYLEDLPLMEILQIVAFSRKTGHLHVESSLGKGAIIFREGLVVCAYSWSTLGSLRRIANGHCDGDENASILEEQIEISLRELARLREGVFHFALTEDLTGKLGGIDISRFLLHRGMNPQHLLLDLTKEIDEDRRDTTAWIESTFRDEDPNIAHERSLPNVTTAYPASVSEEEGEAPSTISEQVVVVVDDEPQVAEVVREELESKGYAALAASGPSEGAALIRERAGRGDRVLVVADLKMPTSSGRSFFGGFELVRRLAQVGLRPPVLLVTETLSDKARRRALELGIRKVVYKPALSKLDPRQYERDLRAFASVAVRQVAEMTAASPEESASDRSRADPEDSPILLDYLASMTEQLVDPNRSTDISRMVLQVAARHLERGILFMIKGERACGLAGFGLGTDDRESTAVARQVDLSIRDIPPFAEVVEKGKTVRLGSRPDVFGGTLYSRINQGCAGECVLLPMQYNREVILVLYGDNGCSGRRLGRLRGLELFMVQAGMAIENTLMRGAHSRDTDVAVKASRT